MKLLQRLERARSFRQDVARFSALLDSPQAGGALALPAGGLFALVARTPQGAAGAALTVRSGRSPAARNVGAPALAAGERWLLGRLERGAVVSVTAPYDLAVDTGRGQFKKILTGG